MIRRPSRAAPRRDAWARLHAGFGWAVPARMNIAQLCCARWAQRPDATERIAVQAHGVGLAGQSLTYRQLQRQADAASGLLARLGVARGDRVAIVLPQRLETAVAYMAVLQMGAIATPLSILFGPEALAFRLNDSGAVAAITDESGIGNLAAVRGDCPALRSVLGVGGAATRADVPWPADAAAEGPAFAAADTAADDPAILIYTSGTTGPPKGALIPHRALIGNLPGFVCSQNWFGFPMHGTGEAQRAEAPARGRAGVGAVPAGAWPGAGDQNAPVFWSPADWAWTGGLMDALLPTLYFGATIVACRERFSPELAFSLMAAQGVTHSFLFPTALKAMMKAEARPKRRFPGLRLAALMSGGEALGEAVFGWCEQALEVTPNEIFGQTEVNYVVGNCAPLWPARPGSMGRPYPGHRVAVIDEAGRECADGEVGEVAVHRLDVHGDPDPIFFLGYWGQPEATAAKFTGPQASGWCRTGDLARRDADGYLWYQGRADDVFKAAGYRIGPGEIENCLLGHTAVANAAVVPKPDRERGAVVKAYIVLAPDVIAARAAFTGSTAEFDADLVDRLQRHVKGRLAPYEYPKEIEFIDQLPMTTTGKVQRRVLRLQEEARAAAATPSR